MSLARRLWHELVRPRGPVAHRFYRGGRRSRSGVALLMVISSVLLLTVLVTEIAQGAVVRVQLAAQHRDDVKAQALAYSGVQFYRMILMASKAIGRNPMIAEFSQMLGVNAQEIWQAIPFVDTRLMRLIFVTDGNMDEDELASAKTAGLSEEQVDESREGSSLMRRNFLDFDGDFHAEVQDEERRVFVGNLAATSFAELLQKPQAQEIMGMFAEEATQEYLYTNNLVKEELIANLADWTDPDDRRLYQGGAEETLYNRLDYPYLPKNAPFDTRDEIRLVDGWHLDGVWERVGRNLTIYGSGKINVNTATKPVLRGLLWAFVDGVPNEATIDNALEQFLLARGTPMAEGGLFLANGEQFATAMQAFGLPLRPEVKDAVTTESKIFRVTAAGEVGNARAEIHAIFDFSQDATGRVLFWKIR